MKTDIFKPLAFIFFAGLLAFSFTSCTEDDESTSSSEVDITNATESATGTYSTSSIDGYVFEVAPETKTLTISGLTTGKNVYLAKVNTGEDIIESKYQRTVESSTVYRSATADAIELGDAELPENQFKHFHAPKIDFESVKDSARAVASTTPTEATPITRTVGTTKNIYVDVNTNMNAYEAKASTLRAVGTYCNVWVVDDYYTSGTASGKQVDTSIAEDIADKFDEFYEIERHVFGEESDKLINSYSSASSLKDAAVDMSTFSDTGTIVNIVVYDIGNDYGSTSQCGVLGYFYAKDYFTKIDSTSNPIGYSNQGKYFYIDSEYAVSEFDTTISTLAHEFQHMIDYGVKDIEQGITPDTAYNEMLSMLCEDMMSDKLGLTDTNNVKSERLPYFNTSYFLSGIREYRNDGYAALSYSTSYGFGSWLCRQYGGAELVHAMSTNAYVDDDSIVNAVNTVNDKDFTFDDLFQQFLVACTNGGSESGFTHNQDASETYTYNSGSYTYPMTAINLWDSTYQYPTTSNKFLVTGQNTAAYASTASTYTGPFLFNIDYSLALRPDYGMVLYQLGETSSDDTLELTFSDSGASDVYMYVIIQ